ncbi:MAG: hypothetical protein AAGA11_01155 [Pseudomonadota bacterium]
MPRRLLAVFALLALSGSVFAAAAAPASGLLVGALSIAVAVVWFGIRQLADQLHRRKSRNSRR